MYRPPYTITPTVLHFISEIQTHLGEYKSLSMTKPSLKLRKENKIKTVHHSLAIEGNSLTEEQISTVLEGKRVLAPKKQIIEVKNALDLYDHLAEINPNREQDLLKSHKILLNQLIDKPGQYRTKGVGIYKGTVLSKMAPSHKQVPVLMKNLFEFLKKDQMTHPLIKACVFHYELEFIHPFEDGNGRMGRLWQQLLLKQVADIFEYIPIESLIHKNQKLYYQALEKSDYEGSSTQFIEFSLEMILKTLQSYSYQFMKKPGIQSRIDFAIEHFKSHTFTRKEYLNLHKGISTATASRDLAQAVREKKLLIEGIKAKAKYRSAN